MPFKTIREFIKLESSSGIILVLMAILALILDNSPLDVYYKLLLSTHFAIHLGSMGIDKPIILWINDGLMVIFFLLVGLEIKREIIIGELSSTARIILPAIAAVGGMVVPALVFILCNHHKTLALHGWAIPTATDIAFALGILAILRSRIPVSLKIFLTALAILDDIGAIIIIAAFYTTHLSILALVLAGICVIVLIALNRLKVTSLTPYILVGIILWICVLKSGVHATLAGVVVALCIPLNDKDNPDYSPLRYLEHSLHPWVAFGVLPLFAFANAGISFGGLHLSAIFSSIPIGIALGLFLGKQIGVMAASWICVKTGLAKLPSYANWWQMYGVSLLCGVGFTMSLFIGTLAFNQTHPEYLILVRVGVLAGSVISGILGYIVLRYCPSHVMYDI